MVNDYSKIGDKLETVAALIGDFLDKKENSEEALILAEKQLSTLLADMKKGKPDDRPANRAPDADKLIRKGGMLLLNSATEILRNPGFLNHALGWSDGVRKPKLIDFIENSHKQKFESLFSSSIKSGKNQQIEVLLQTGFDTTSKCLLEIDIFSSNIKNNRFVIHYSFNKDFDILAFDFQAVVFDNLPDMDVFLFDKEYRYILSGGKEKERNNLSNSYLLGKTIFDVFDKRTVRRIFPFYNKAINGIHTEGEVRYKKYIYHIVASPIKNKDNETVAGILVSQNITKDKQLEENLIKSREEARKADKAKSIFLANMSHEIRTPLNSIAGFTEQLNKTDLNGQQQKLVSLINNASEHLLYIVNEIIILFKLGMDKVHIEKIAFSIDELLEELHDIFKKQANEKGLSFKVDIDDKLPGTLNGDPFRLRQILMNLLINAVKYTDKGEIKLSCKMLSETAKSVELLFEVSDTGIGIDKKDMPNIFDVFEQGNKRTERIRGGAGLGLGICKKLVDLFNGQIFVESKLHKGSTFSVQIPFKKSKLTKIRKKEKNFSLEDNLLSRKKILLADDDEHNLLLAEMILKGWDTDFILAKNGKEATGILKDKKFDLILLDIHMPKRSGVQVIKALRSSKNGLNHSTPALALTANVLKADLNRYLKAGFNGYVKKPYKETNLYSKICNILQLEPGNHNTTKIQKSSIDKSSRLNSFEIEELKNVSKGDKVFFNKMIDNFANNAETLLIAFNSGIENKDLEEIGEKAHKAIPSFRFFKLNNIAASLEEIEHVALKQKRFTGLPEIIGQAEIEIKSAIQQAKASKK